MAHSFSIPTCVQLFSKGGQYQERQSGSRHGRRLAWRLWLACPQPGELLAAVEPTAVTLAWAETCSLLLGGPSDASPNPGGFQMHITMGFLYCTSLLTCSDNTAENTAQPHRMLRDRDEVKDLSLKVNRPGPAEWRGG